MAPPRKYKTEEERLVAQRERTRERVARYKLKTTDANIGIGKGRPFNGETRTMKKIGNYVVHKRDYKDCWRPEPTIELTKDSTVDDMLKWVLEVAEELRQNPAPAAWASAMNNVLKIIEYMDKRFPPERPPAKPRPRACIVIDMDEFKEEV